MYCARAVYFRFRFYCLWKQLLCGQCGFTYLSTFQLVFKRNYCISICGFSAEFWTSGIVKFTYNYDHPKHCKGTVEQDGLSSIAMYEQIKVCMAAAPGFHFLALLRFYFANKRIASRPLFQMIILVFGGVCVLWIRGILVRIRIRGSVPLTDPDPAFFFTGWQDANKKYFFCCLAK